MINLNKKGFTLIELLAVIIILVIVALIATPIIFNVVEDARKSAGQSEANMVLSGINTYCEQEKMGIAKTDYCTDSKKLSDNLDKIVNLGKVDKKEVEVTIKDGKLDWLKVTSNGKNFGLSNGKMEEGIVEKPIISISFAEDSWDTIAKIVKSGKANKKYKLGDTKEVAITGYINTPEKPTFTVRIANMSTPEECKHEGFSQTACGFVVEFVDIISISSMNENRTNVGGWPASKIVKILNIDSKSLLSLLPIDLQELILSTFTVSSHGESESLNFNMDNKLYLLSAREIYGFEGELNSGSKDLAYNLTRDLEYYKAEREKINNPENKEIYIKKYQNLNNSWWLRSASSHIDFRNGFFDISETGEISFTPSTFEEGVAPAFRIG